MTLLQIYLRAIVDMRCTLEDGRAVVLHVDQFLQVNERSAVCRGFCVNVDVFPRLIPMRRLYAKTINSGCSSNTPILLKFGDPRRLVREARALERMEQRQVSRVPRKVLAGIVCFNSVTLHVLGLTFFEGPTLAAGSVALTAEGVQLLRATLEAIHRSCNLVHRDVKPDNIIIAKGGVPILVDFDCAGDIGEKGFRGTSLWASPHALSGQGAVPSDDFYSLDLILQRGANSTTLYSPPTPPSKPDSTTLRSPPTLSEGCVNNF